MEYEEIEEEDTLRNWELSVVCHNQYDNGFSSDVYKRRFVSGSFIYDFVIFDAENKENRILYLSSLTEVNEIIRNLEKMYNAC